MKKRNVAATRSTVIDCLLPDPVFAQSTTGTIGWQGKYLHRPLRDTFIQPHTREFLAWAPFSKMTIPEKALVMTFPSEGCQSKAFHLSDTHARPIRARYARVPEKRHMFHIRAS